MNSRSKHSKAANKLIRFIKIGEEGYSRQIDTVSAGILVSKVRLNPTLGAPQS